LGYKLPYEQRRAILAVLANGIEKYDIRQTVVKKEEWMNPRQVYDNLKKHFDIDLGRDKITSFLDECAVHEKEYVKRKSKKDEDKPTKKKDFVEPKAQREFRITESGKNLLAIMNSPDFEFVSKRF